MQEKTHYYWSSPQDYKKRVTSPEKLEALPCFSLFQQPVKNTRPFQNVNLVDIYNYLISPYAKDKTEQLRNIKDEKYRRQFKASFFDNCTFSGIFSCREDIAIIQPSFLLCIDFDHLPNVNSTALRLISDTTLKTLLLFKSPSGDGLKWVISYKESYDVFVKPGETIQHYHARHFKSVANYLWRSYGLEVDMKCGNISRTCFLPHDPEPYLNPFLL